MSLLLKMPPYGRRDESLFLQELNALVLHHLAGCPAFAKIWPNWRPTQNVEVLPFLHVGLFKHIEMRTSGFQIRHARTLKSSATSSGKPSLIVLDDRSNVLQSESSSVILADFLGATQRPLLILDSVRSLQLRGEVTARIAAAMSLRPLANEIHFLLEDSADPSSVNWAQVENVLARCKDILVYGFSWMLWQGWACQEKPSPVLDVLRNARVSFVHSGGWKRLESKKVTREVFDAALLSQVAPGSSVLDYYGLVEQAGVVYPLCSAGARHVPVWAMVLVRDPYSLEVVADGEVGLLQFINTLAWGAPYFSVLTEDMGRIISTKCDCGRSGPCFELLGRVPDAEVRGCANV